MGKIWLIGGTSESKQLAIALQAEQVNFVVTVTTESAVNLYPTIPSEFIYVGKLNAHDLSQFIQTQQITAILDASHPFAQEISMMAIAIAEKLQLPYLRFERHSLTTEPNYPDHPWVKRFSSFVDLLKSEYLDNQRILLTVGYRSLPLFKPWQSQSVLFARILPSVTSLEAALSAGFTSDRLIALRPPISLELETALVRQWQITTMIAKASGSAGGESVKVAIATELHIPLLIVDRPQLDYPRQTSNYETAIQFCRQRSN